MKITFDDFVYNQYTLENYSADFSNKWYYNLDKKSLYEVKKLEFNSKNNLLTRLLNKSSFGKKYVIITSEKNNISMNNYLDINSLYGRSHISHSSDYMFNKILHEILNRNEEVLLMILSVDDAYKLGYIPVFVYNSLSDNNEEL